MYNAACLIFNLIVYYQKTNLYKGIYMRFMLIFTIFLSSSCSIIEDPSQGGGLVSTTANIVSGSYDERLQKRQKVLSDAKAKKQQLKQDTQQLEVDKLTSSQQVEVEKLNEIDSTIKGFEKKLNNNNLKFDKKNRARQLRKLKELKSRNNKLQQQINANNNSDTLAAIQEERDRLDKELSLLLEVSQ